MAKFKWNNPWEWFSEAWQRGDVSSAEIELLLRENVDNDAIQDHFESSMIEDGFFEQIDPGGWMTFVTDCVSASYQGKRKQDVADEIFEMSQNGTTIEYEEFVERVHEEELEELFPSYTWGYRNKDLDLTLEDDWGVEFCESYFFGRKCYYIVHSSTEYIWVADEVEE